MQWKGHIPAGQVDDRPVIQLDILPTALTAAGVGVPSADKLDGVNLLPYLTGKNTAAPHDGLFWRFGKQRAVRMGNWKMTDMGDGPHLFNVTKDISEQNDLAAADPEKLQSLEAAWKQWDSGNIEPKWAPGGGNKKPGAKKKAAAN